MNLTLLLPAALAALAALALPLLLHLVRRSEQRVVDFAALRWLHARRRPQRRAVFEERLLLLLRLLLLALLALFLAVPVLLESPRTRPWVAVVPGADLAAARAQLQSGEADWRWLAPGFPPLGDPQPAPQQPVASLLRDLDAQLPAATPLTVVVPPVLQGLDGARPTLGREVDWREVGGPATPAPSILPPPRLALRHPPGREAAARHLRALGAAWDAGAGSGRGIDVAASDALPPDDADVLVWLHPELPAAVQAWAEAGRTLVLEPGTAPEIEAGDGVAVWRDAEGEVLARARALGEGRLIRLQRPLRPEALPLLLEPAFPEAWLAVLQPPPAPTRATAGAHRPLRADLASDGAGLADSARALQPWLALLLAALLLVERLVATRAGRWSA